MFHATALAEDPRVEGVVVGDVDAKRAAAVAQRIGGEAGSIEEVIGSGLDAATIAATTSAHADLIKVCLDAGLPVF